MKAFLAGAKSAWEISCKGLVDLPLLWIAIGFYALLNAFTGACAAVVFPREIAEPTMSSGILGVFDESQAIFSFPLLVAFVFLSYSVVLLGGTISSMSLVFRGEAVPFRTFLQQIRCSLPAIVRWAAGAMCLTILSGLLLITIPLLVWLSTKEIFLMQLVSGLIFLFIVFPLGLCLLYSPIILVGKQTGFWDSFCQSCRFLFFHFLENVWLLIWVLMIGFIMCVMWIIPTVVLDSIVQRMGMDPYAWSFPTVFFLGLILWIPAAVFAVYFPVVLCRHYYSQNPVSRERS